MLHVWRQLRRRSALLLVCALATGFGGAAIATAATDPDATASNVQQRPTKPTLDELLDRFPIGTQPVRTTPVQERVPPAAKKPGPKKPGPASSGSSEATNVSEGSDDSAVGDKLWVVLLAGAGALLLLAVTGIRAVRVHRGERPRAFSVSTSSVSEPTLALFHQTLALASKGRSPQVTELSHDRNSPLPATQEQTRQKQSRPDSVGEHDYAGVGDHVIGILEAAEVAAAQIRADAADVAAEIRKAAEAEASVHLQRAHDEATKIHSEAEASAESIEAERRSEVEELVRTELADAETQARATRETAEESARQIEIAARERAEVLTAQVQPLEENMRRALEAFRGISSQLEELLEPEQEEPDESLVEALSASAKQGGSRE